MTQMNLTFNGWNGNRLENITAEEMAAYLKDHPGDFVPNWYKSGLESRNEALTMGLGKK